MKKINVLYLVMTFVLAMSCGEEHESGPLVEDSIVPGSVTNIVVNNVPGGADLTYDVPTDEDLLYVEVIYTNNGEEFNDRSSGHSNKVSIRGLMSTEPQEVTMISVDKSNNKSVPTTVTIQPTKAPITRLFDSFVIEPDFGGPRIDFENQDDFVAEILVFVKDETGEWIYRESAFLSENDNETERIVLRGYPPVETEFAFTIVDRWNNVTSRKVATLTPLAEIEVDKTLFNEIELTGDARFGFGLRLRNLWDGITGGWPSMFHTNNNDTPGLPIVPPYTEQFHMFTIDLGAKYRLDRFKWYMRTDCCGAPFGHGDPRRYEVWAIDEIPADNGASLDGWTRLVENGEVIRPSGLTEAGVAGQHPQIDLDKQIEGEETVLDFPRFDPFTAPQYRYVRFVNFENWTGGKWLHVTEMTFWAFDEN